MTDRAPDHAPYGPQSFKPRRGWPEGRTPWWCDRCRTMWHGLYRWMNGGCPQPVAGWRPGVEVSGHGRRCGQILLDPEVPSRSLRAELVTTRKDGQG